MLAGSIAASKLVGTDIATVGTITSGTWNGTVLGATYGGTAQTTWTTGDILYASGTNTLAKLGIGSAGQALTVSGGIPSWGSSGGSNWQRNSGAIAPLNITDDLLIGAIATASAKFRISSLTGDATISGTLSLAPKLQVDAGTCDAAAAGKQYYDATNTKYYYCNGTSWFPVGETSGQIAAFASTCPSGWTEYTAARGRYIVGNPSGGTLAGTAGTALTDLENRAVGQHNHAITDSGHTHSEGVYTYGYTFASGPYGWGGNPSGGTTGSSTTGITINNSGSVAGTNAPYIQLTYCSKDTGSDLAEWIPGENISGETIVSVDPNNREKVMASDKPYDSKVLGIVSTKPGWLIGDQKDGNIKLGDAITTSDIAGVGMKATGPGWIVGKAMEALDGDANTTGTILVFLTPTWQDGVDEESLVAKIASISAELVNLKVSSSSESAVLSDTNWVYATESGKLATIFNVQVPELTVTGKLAVGLMTFDDLDSSISSLTGTINIRGDLAVSGSLKVLGTSAGKAIIPAGETLISINSSLISTSSAIFVTPEEPNEVGARATESGKFVIRIPSALPADLRINWWVIN
mgnify:CR=1 FL=1